MSTSRLRTMRRGKGGKGIGSAKVLLSRPAALLAIGLVVAAAAGAGSVIVLDAPTAGHASPTSPALSASGLRQLASGARQRARLVAVAARADRPVPVAGGFAVNNAVQRLQARFGRGGVEVQTRGTKLGLSLMGYGSGSSVDPASPAAPVELDGRIVYRMGAVTESWSNGLDGLEQTFTLAAPPAGGAARPLDLQLAVSGQVHAKLLSSNAVIFRGEPRSLLYRDLIATDARGHRLSAWMQLIGRRLLLRINTRFARYPLRVDPTIASTSTTTSDAYAQAVLADTPSMYLRLDEPSGGVAHDSSGNSNDASYASGINYGAAGALVGNGDTAITMPANGWWLTQSGDSFPAKNGSRTVEFWVRTTDYNALPTFVYGGSSGTAQDQFRVQLEQSGGGSYMWLSTTSSGGYGSGQYTLALPRAWWDGNWHMYDVTFDGTNAVGFMDGQIAGTFPVTTPLATVTPGSGMEMGQLGDGGSISVDEVAVYPTALTPARIDAHWSAGGATEAACPAAPTTPYGQSVVADAPSVYLRLGDIASDATDRVAHDYSGQCTTSAPTNGAYMSGVTATQGGLAGDSDGAITMPGSAWWLTRSDNTLPAGNASRTVEFWVRTTDYNALPTFVYGGSSGGTNDQFRVQLEQSGGGSYMWLGNSSSGAYGTVQYQLSLPRAWWDGNWHMFDVTYDGSTAVGYMDGQVVGSFPLTTTLATVLPGQGMLMGQLGDGGSISVDELAVYPTALAPARIDAHWSAGGSTGACAPASTAPYAQTVVSDAPSLYLRLDELDANASARVAYDSSGHCTATAPTNAAYMSGVADQPNAALSGDPDGAITMPGSAWWLTRSGENLPAGNGARTVEFWVRTTDYNALPTFVYGGSSGGTNDQFRVQLEQSGGGSYMWLGINSSGAYGTAQYSITLPRAWWDGNWHMYDVSFDGATALGYMDGQVVGTFPLPANTQLATVVPGTGMRVGQLGDGGSIDVDELAVYPAALPSKRIDAHWEAQYLTPPGTSLIAGNAVQGGGGGIAGARAQACPTSGASCIVDPYPTGSSGYFHMVVPDDTYTVTIFPPSGSPSTSVTLSNLTVPPSAQNLTATFTPPGGLPTGATFSSPSTGSQSSSVPRVNWGEPSSYSVGACKNGVGRLLVQGTNTSTGLPETVSAPLLESSAGSGTYQATIPPLAPVHGGGSGTDAVICPQKLGLVPSGGPPSGGTKVLLNANGGFTGATAVTFGSTPASSFTVLTDDFILASAPAGSGSVPVTVTGGSGQAIPVGTYTYFQVSSLSVGTGPASGGTTVTITGQGFSSGDQVMFGLAASQSVTYVSPTELQAVAPPGIGTVNVEVLQGNSVSQPSSSALFVNQNGPAGTSDINQSTTSPQQYTQEVENACAVDVAPGLTLHEQDEQLCGAADFAKETLNEARDALVAEYGPAFLSYGVATLLDDFKIGAKLFNYLEPVAELLGPVGDALFIISVGDDVCKILTGAGCRWDFWNLFIDPSGTVVDTANNPISGATATILSQPSGGGTFSAVDPASGAIEPATNPQTTGSTGAFDWEALAGTYEIEASKSGCHAPGNSSQPNVFTQPFAIPPPAVGLVLTLDCGASTPPTPTVTGLPANSGPTSGGNTVDISGTGLVGATAVHFGGAAATNFQVLSPYAIAAVAPAGSGTVDVTVTTSGGTTAIGSADQYSYLAPPPSTSTSPAITGVSPATGPVTGGAVVTISGTHLDGAYGVSFGGTAATYVTDVSSTEVKAVAPAAQFPGRVDITVTTASGTSLATSADIFTYGSPPPPPTPTVKVSVSPNPSSFHQAVTLMATVSPTDGGGSIAFFDNGAAAPINGCGSSPLTGAGSKYQATCSTSTLSPGAHTITAVYSGDSSYASATAATPASVIGVPQNTSPPGFSGNAVKGQTLREVHGSWTFNPSSYSYRWEDCDRSGAACSMIVGATASTYTLSANDVGHTIRVQEIATNSAGNSAPATSAPTQVVQVVLVPPTVAQVKAALAAVLFPKGKNAKIAALLRTGGYRFTFVAPSAGTLTISWYYQPPHAAGRRAARPELVAAVTFTAPQAGMVKVTAKLTKIGRALLKHANQVKLLSKVSFTPAGAKRVIRTQHFTVRR